MKSFTFLLLGLLLNVVIAQDITPIVNLRINDGTGVPTGNTQYFKVRGVVTSTNHFGSSGPGSLQDETGGISVFGSSFAGPLVIGDTVEVYSQLTHFNGLTQFNLSSAGSTVLKKSSGIAPDPTVLTVSQVLSQAWNGYEEHESKLIRIDNCQISGSGNFASGTNYNISDGTGTMQLRIDNDVSSVIGTPIPSGSVDIVGILGQFKSSAPYSTGYQILPRFLADFIYDGAPQILTPILAADITPNSFKVYFNTVRPGNAKVTYGLNTSADTDSVILTGDTVAHVIPVTGLQPATTYYYKVYSSNAAGTSASPVQSVITGSDDPSTGTMNVYFNYSVDTTVSIPGNAAKGNQDYQQLLVNRINRAVSSIDMAVYSFTGLNNVISALITAKNRGVRIRVVYDSRTNQPGITSLLSAGIKINKRTSTNGIMHNKFLVFDARDTITSNDWVWTGSYNLTTTELNWKNNVIEINDPSLAQAYTLEFEEMWGSSTEDPNASQARFGSSKLDNTPHAFSIGGREVALYFSPSDQTTSRIISAIGTANFSVYYNLYTFTRSEIATALRNKHDIGVNLRGIIDQTGDNSTQYNYLLSFSEVYPNASAGTSHHKYALIDPSFPSSDPLVITGSHNWSTSAETINDENTLIIKDALIANQYMQEFKKRYNDEGGTGVFVVPTDLSNEMIPGEISFQVSQNYPNPFNPFTTLRIIVSGRQHLTITVTDILGREVTTLYNDHAEEGVLAIDFNPKHRNLDLASGVYLLNVSGSNLSVTKKMVYLR